MALIYHKFEKEIDGVVVGHYFSFEDAEDAGCADAIAEKVAEGFTHIGQQDPEPFSE